MSAVAEAEVREFEEHRSMLFGVAYRMLGSATDAEDIVQDAYLRFQAAPRDDVRSIRSYLVTIVSRLCLDHLKSARVQRERYVGPWLPEPILTTQADWRDAPEGVIDLRESVSMAFLVLLETLTPVERAVLLLHDVFDYSHAEVASIVEKSEPATRQVLKRARDRLNARTPRHAAPAEELERLVVQFLHSAATGDVDSLVEMLAADAVLYSDGGGKVPAALNPIHGADRVARLSLGLGKKEPVERTEVREINGQPALVMWLGHRVTNVVLIELESTGRVSRVYVQRNPDKCHRLRRLLWSPSLT